MEIFSFSVLNGFYNDILLGTVLIFVTFIAFSGRVLSGCLRL